VPGAVAPSGGDSDGSGSSGSSQIRKTTHQKDVSEDVVACVEPSVEAGIAADAGRLAPPSAIAPATTTAADFCDSARRAPLSEALPSAWCAGAPAGPAGSSVPEVPAEARGPSGTSPASGAASPSAGAPAAGVPSSAGAPGSTWSDASSAVVPSSASAAAGGGAHDTTITPPTTPSRNPTTQPPRFTPAIEYTEIASAMTP